MKLHLAKSMLLIIFLHLILDNIYYMKLEMIVDKLDFYLKNILLFIIPDGQ